MMNSVQTRRKPTLQHQNYIMTKEPRHCPSCKTYTVTEQVVSTQGFAYRNLAHILLPADFTLPHCTTCNRLQLTPQASARLAQLLQLLYQTEIQQRARAAIDRLNQVTTQHRIEQLLGLSQGYLSRIRAGQRQPSEELVSHLTLLARQPDKYVRRLERFWTRPCRPLKRMPTDWPGL